jgi:hypothetical protein
VKSEKCVAINQSAEALLLQQLSPPGNAAGNHVQIDATPEIEGS